MKTVTIPAGYRLIIDSWENDGDNSQQVTLDGLSELEVTAYTQICKLIAPGEEISNLYGEVYDNEDLDNAILAIVPILQEAKIIKGKGKPSVKKHVDVVSDVLSKLGLNNCDYFTRVCEKFNVQYIKEPVVLEDVTERFSS